MGLNWDDRESGSSAKTMKRQQQQQSHARLAEAVNCPRCDSTNTKFCYYNNYNKSQPRHFCRACKRHWTKGGTLRNVPVGGGRKNKRSKKSSDQVRPPPANSSGEDHDEKSVSEILYRAVMARPPAMSAPSFTEALAFPQTLGMISGTSSPFESSLSSISSSFHNGDDRVGRGIAGDQSSGFMSAMARSPWQQFVETPSYGWNFENIDTLVSSDHINLPWDESLHIEP